jgi:glutamate synthase (NADPH/NADH) large chain
MIELEELDAEGQLDLEDLLGHYAAELRVSDQGPEAERVLDLVANASDNFLQIVPHRVQADPSISTE